MKLFAYILWSLTLLVATFAMIGYLLTHRYTTNTAGGRFYRTDKWQGITIVVEKDGSQRTL